MSGGDEMFAIENEKKADAGLHEPILANPEADEFIRKSAIERALARGMTVADATALYGDAPVPEENP